MMVDREWLERDNRRTGRRVKEAKLPVSGAIEEVVADAARTVHAAEERHRFQRHFGHHHHLTTLRSSLLRFRLPRSVWNGCAQVVGTSAQVERNTQIGLTFALTGPTPRAEPRGHPAA